MKKILCAGSFDLLHSGHVAFLKTAASYGEVYVGIGSDASIKVFKNRETVCPQQERLFMVKSIRYVKDAWINLGVGDMDFILDLEKNHPIGFDMFIFNEDQNTPEKREYCRRNNIELLILPRVPEPGLPCRCSTDLRKYYGK